MAHNSDYPELENWTWRENIPAKRWAVSGVPPSRHGWGFHSFPNKQSEAWVWMRAWAASPKPDVPGVVLCGRSGWGKTGLALSACRARAEAGDGSRATWNLATAGAPSGIPAPVWWEPWMALTTRLNAGRRRRYEDTDEPTEESIWEELGEVCFLALDDIDVGRWGSNQAWREEQTLLRFVERTESDAGAFRLILTTNLHTDQWEEHFGERLADRWGNVRVFRIIELDKGTPSLRHAAP